MLVVLLCCFTYIFFFNTGRNPPQGVCPPKLISVTHDAISSVLWAHARTIADIALAIIPRTRWRVVVARTTLSKWGEAVRYTNANCDKVLVPLFDGVIPTTIRNKQFFTHRYCARFHLISNQQLCLQREIHCVRKWLHTAKQQNRAMDHLEYGGV